jgi:2-dehydro-3-deoxy-D-arabinonate dehydratase
MRFYRLLTEGANLALAVETPDGSLVDLTSIDPDLTEIEDLALASSLSGITIDEAALNLIEAGDGDSLDLKAIVDGSRERGANSGPYLDRPFDPPEVWAAGVTYKTSEMERRRESKTPDIYSRVYAAKRPELFMKATPERCVGPFEAIGVREDSEWNVPEPELAFVLYKGEIIGYTIGNDVSSRSIEGENPLYLPQAKMYDRCCAIGPCFVTVEALGAANNLGIRCEIRREGKAVFEGETSTSSMARSCEELADWLLRHNTVPNMTTVLTGTAIVPPPDFTLQEDDVVSISIEGIGVLENDVLVNR